MKSNSNLHPVPEAAALLRVAAITVWRLLRTGKLACHRIGRRVLVSDKQLAAYTASLDSGCWERIGSGGRPRKAVPA